MNYQRDGHMSINSQGGAPNYYPNSFRGPEQTPSVKEPAFNISGQADRYTPANEDNFSQVTTFWRDVLDSGAKTRLVNNLVTSLKRVSPFIVQRAVANFTQVDQDLGTRLRDGLKQVGTPIFTSEDEKN